MKKTFILENLDCPNCANKIERRIKALNEVKDATLDFMKLKLIMECENEHLMEQAIIKAKKIIKDLEPDVEMVEGNRRVRNNEHHDHHHEHHDHEHCSCHEHHHDHDHCECHHHNHHNHHDHHDHHDHHEHHDRHIDKKKIKLILAIASLMLFIAGIIVIDEIAKLILFLVAYLLIGYEILWKSIKNIFKGEIFDENFLMSIASIVAFAIGEYIEAFAVMFLYQLGEHLQDSAVNKSRKSISNMIGSKVEKANKLIGNEIKEVDCYDVEINDIIVVKVGEQIPLDGIVVEGSCTLDASMLSGESIPLYKKEGDEVLSGMINKDEVIKIKVTKLYEDSTLSKILDLIENATSKKSSNERFITKFAKIYTPIVCLIALLIAIIPLFFNESFDVWGYRACVFLVTSCPCALVISVPLSYFVGIGVSSKEGVLIKGSSYLEELTKISKIYLDKTGTLTKGEFRVNKVVGLNSNENEVLIYAYLAEYYSNHPISKSIKKSVEIEFDVNLIEDYKEIAGKGVEAIINKEKVKAGNQEFVNFKEEINEAGTVVFVSKNDIVLGYLIIEDELKEEVKECIGYFAKENISPILLTGDREDITKKVCDTIGIKEYHSNLLPLEKVIIIKEDSECVSFVGDGINDAPALISSNVGIAMGGLGSDAAIESSDIVLMKDDLKSLVNVHKIAKKTRKIVIQNIAFSLSIKTVIMILGVIGISPLWLAVFADVGVALIAILNSFRIKRYK